MKGTVEQQVRSGVALLTIDAPPVNALSHPVRKALHEALHRASVDDAIVAVVLTGANRAFVAGADLSELGEPLEHPDIRELFSAVDRLPKPVVAAIGGMALGGGLELALCCDRRVAAPHASIGLPEVTLGLLPGGGGTQRLPRLVGLETAASLILSGEIVSARRAAALGIIDEVVEGDEVEAAVEWARELGQRGKSSLRRLSRAGVRPSAGRDPVALLSEACAAATRRTPGRYALEMIAQCLEAAATAPDFAAGMAVESACFDQCHAHPQHRALLHLFFAERACAKLPGIGRDVEARPIRTAALVGGGAHAGLAVGLAAASVQVLERSRLPEADVVIVDGDDELEAQQDALARVDREAKPGALLVAVTTSLDVDALARAVRRPADLVGLCLPPGPATRVVQVIRGACTGPEALLTAMRLGKRLGKLAVAVGNAPGLVGARVCARLAREVEALRVEGVSRALVHRVLARYGPSLMPALDDGPEAPREPAVDEREILDRCLHAMADEGRRLLEEGVAVRASDVDVICVHGYGFPDVAGGPMFWAEQQGPARRRHAERSDAPRPAPSLERRVAEGHGLPAE